MLSLRPYQTQAIDQMRALMRQGCRSILYQGATGSGKTALTAHMLHTAAGKGMRSWFVVHRRELIHQSQEAFNKEGLKHGTISAGTPDQPTMRVQIASVQTLARRIDRQSEPQLIVWDECHHLAAAGWEKIFRRFPHAFHIGLTATPARLDGRGLGSYFKEMIRGPSISSLIEQGYLSPYKMYAPSTISTEGLHKRMGDYAQEELAARADRPTITGNAIAHYKRLAHGKRAIVFAVSIEHSKHIVEQFCAAGYHAKHIDGETSQEERDEAIAQFRAGALQVLSNVELFGEGFDVPSVEAIICLRPTQSVGLYLQQIGRALRPSENKTVAVLLDHAGNCQRHGLPDEERQWSLEGAKSRTDHPGRNVSVKVCPSCFAAQLAGHTQCRFCGFVFEVKPRKVEEVEGELQEVDLTTARLEARKEQGMAYDRESLLDLARKRKYKNPHAWVFYILRAREQKRKEQQARKVAGFR